MIPTTEFQMWEEGFCITEEKVRPFKIVGIKPRDFSDKDEVKYDLLIFNTVQEGDNFYTPMFKTHSEALKQLLTQEEKALEQRKSKIKYLKENIKKMEKEEEK